MKKYIVLVYLSCCLQQAAGQLLTNLVMSATPSASITDWNNRKEILTYIVSSQGGNTIAAKIKTEIRLNDGTLVATRILPKQQYIIFSTATNILYAADVLALENMIFTGKYKTALQRTGKLISDNYNICVQLVAPTDYVPRSEVKCKNFYIASLQLPIAVIPADDMVLDLVKGPNCYHIPMDTRSACTKHTRALQAAGF